MFKHLGAGKSPNSPETKRRRAGTGEGADSAFGEMINDRPLVHRPDGATPEPPPKPEPKPKRD